MARSSIAPRIETADFAYVAAPRPPSLRLAEHPDASGVSGEATPLHVVTFQRANMYARAGGFQKAAALFRESIEIKPFSGTYYNLAIMEERSERLLEAISFYRKALKIQPDFAEAHYSLGTALLRIGQREEAIDAFRNAVEANPNHAAAQYNLGTMLFTAKQLPDSIAALRKAVEIEPEDAKAFNNLGLALRFGGHPLEAIAALRRAIEIEPDSKGYFVLGVALDEADQLPQAIDAFRKSLEIEPIYAKSYFALGAQFVNNDQPQEAIDPLRKAVEVEPNDARAHYILGTQFVKNGQLPEAIDALRKAIEIEPNDALAHYILGAALNDNGQHVDAIAAYRKAVEIKPDVKAYRGIGAVSLQIGHLPEAIAAFHEAIKLKPDDAKAHSGLGFAFKKQGDLPEAIIAFYKAIVFESDPKSRQAWLPIIEGLRIQLNKFDAVKSNYPVYSEVTMDKTADKRAIAKNNRISTVDLQRDIEIWKAAEGGITERTTAVAAKRKSRPKLHAHDLSEPHPTALMEDVTLSRLDRRYRELLAKTLLPADGFKTIDQARAASRLSATFANLQARRKLRGLEPLPMDDRVKEAMRLKSSFYYQPKGKTAQKPARRTAVKRAAAQPI